MTTTAENETMVIQPRVRGFICITAHPKGCAAHVQEQIDYVKKQGALEKSPKNVLVIGASTGYGLASRITAAFGGKANTLGIFFEKLPVPGKTATAGWYNSEAVAKLAQGEGLYAENINGDAFSDEIKQQAVEAIKKNMGKVDLVVYSLASPVRTRPADGVTYRSVLKPIGQTFSAKTLDTDKELVKDVTIESAVEKEVEDTVVVMGGEDWQIWMDVLKKADVLADNAVSVAYSYIGPEVTWAVYKDGAIGKAKKDLEQTAKNITAGMKDKGIKAYVSVNKAVVTQASSAIPVVPLYISLLFKVMKEKNLHEDCIEQIHRLFSEQLYNGKSPKLDEEGRIRLDDKEMDKDVQAAVTKLWQEVTTENLKQISDFSGYKANFLKLFGFGLAGVDYTQAVDPTKV